MGRRVRKQKEKGWVYKGTNCSEVKIDEKKKKGQNGLWTGKEKKKER